MGRKIVNRVGEIHLSNKGDKIEVIECFGNENLTIKFSDGTIARGVTHGDLKRNKVKNYNKPNYLDIGYVGYGIYCTLRNKAAYRKWGDMLRRCYHSEEPTYKDCTVHSDWHNFQNFAAWFESNYKSETMSSWHLDKDILIKGNRVYGPDTCCFVPTQINSLFRRHVKCKTIEDVIKLANEHKETLSEKVYLALINYKF